MKFFDAKYTDRTFWMIFFFLIGCSILSMFSASSVLIRQATARGLSTYQPMISHIGFLALGVIVAFGIQYIPSKFIRLGSYLLLIFSIFTLLLTFTSFAVSANDANRWVRIGGIQFQPSEFAKLSLIIVVSDLLSRIKTEEDYKKYYVLTLLVTGIVCALIVPNNLSTVILIGGVVLLMMFLVRVPLKWLAGLVGTLLLVLVLGYLFVEFTYVRPNVKMDGPMSRATVWVKRVDQKFKKDNDDKFEVTDANYQAIMAEAAVARGGHAPWGVGPGNSVQRDRLPLAFMDYIFAIIVEETGILGAIFISVLYLWMLFRACRTSSKYQNYAAMLMVMGLAIMLTTQAFVSMAVSVGLGPVTGQPLPLISRGGTSILITSIYFGIMMAVSREQNMLQAQETQTLQKSKENIPELEL